MSLFGIGGGASGPPQGNINPQQMDIAIAELDMITDVFNRLVSWVAGQLFISELVLTVTCRSCHTKCVSPRYSEPDLNKGESVCIDRCVAKFFEVNKKVGERLQLMGGNAQATGTFRS
ncbi:hypothetical protein BS47DRAFT_1339262 [Hydnum rufescens UP504]|uniref:Mitochondrial import inner membrane translocase subunit n=1 Tax=Hydnum rufescens UP504 TaxID=1448309 RepID=A0A9P6DXR7_9AGAM|nr:hypothetical protein BS47DRAFT_1339262 [Hydnum rufescens UP504]